MTTTAPNVLTILKELSTALGQDAVKAACEQFLGGKKQKKERKPRGKSSWNLEVDKVLEEMQAAVGEGETVTYKMAFAEASRRKREGDPEAQAKYEVYRAKVEAKRAEKVAAKGGATDEAAASTSLPAYDDSKVYNFLFDLQKSGVTNMLGCVPYLQEEFGMEKAEANVYRDSLVTKYRELRDKYRPETSLKEGGATAKEEKPTKEEKPAEEKKGRGRPKKTAAA